ncbi:unnamed protein product [Clavelina lepadiformis]|uniref:Uncharacterized protein n=1 Tax=Clavelina lepadiformis TaxID=159417 RepID=A0ABP0G6N0_CLALP
MNPTDLPLMHQVCLHLPPASLFLIHSCLVHKTVCSGANKKNRKVRKKHFLYEDLRGVEESSSRNGLFRHWQKLHRSMLYVSRQSRSIQPRREYYTENSDHVSLYLLADKCDRRSAIPKASTRFSSQRSAVSHFVKCRIFPKGMKCGDIAESWNAE